MNHHYLFLLCCMFVLPAAGLSQVNEAYDDFEGNRNIPLWSEDDCNMDINFTNPHQQGSNLSTTVLRYEDIGGQYANVRFQMNDNFDLSTNQTFSLKIYVPSSGITGNQPHQVSLKLQDGLLPQPWVTQSEIIQPITLNEWQTVTFNFAQNNYQNLDPNSIAPTLRTDFNRVVIQVNGEGNSDRVLAYLDDILLFQGSEPVEPMNPVFNKLVWSDEFEVDGAVDAAKWHHQTTSPQANGCWFNGEVQHYTDRTANSVVENGVLKMTAKKESYTHQGITKAYTSARLNSKFAFTYGRIDIRAKLPTGIGTWPALWMLGKNIQETGAYWDTQGYGTTAWPACGEIDIMEHWGHNQDHISSAIHTPSSFGGTVNVGGKHIPNVSTQFHVYAVVWTAEKIVFSVDGIVHYTYNPSIKNAETWPFDLDQYILFNVAMLPSVPSNFTESAMEVDYIRVYQEGEAESECKENIAISTPVNQSMAFKAQKNITISTTIENGTVTAQAETITLLPNTYIPSGTNFHAFIEPCQVEVLSNQASLPPEKSSTSRAAEKDLTTLLVYPNPLVNSTTLRFYLNKEGLTQISVYDMNGRLIVKRANQLGLAGWNELFLDTSMLSEGTHIIQVRTETGLFTNRLLKF